MAQHKTELDLLREYLLDPGTEKAKEHLIFPAQEKTIWELKSQPPFALLHSNKR
jgi:hypothetical protein